MHFDFTQCKQKGFLTLSDPELVEGESKGFAPVLVLVGIVVIAVVAGGAYYFGKLPIKPANNTPEACTEEAKICPDGSSVGRVGPNCEFAQCPVTTPKASEETVNWKTYTNTKLGYSFKYPSDFELTEESSDRIFISNNLPPSPNCKGGGCNLGISRLSIYFEHLNNLGEDKLNLDEFAQKRRNALLTINKDQENIQISQKYDYEMRYFEGTTEGYNHHYYLKLNPDTSFVITTSFPSKEEVTKYSELEDQILSTFKFK